MSATMNLSLTDELKSFVQQNSGNGTLYSTPSEFIRYVIRERKEKMDAADLRNGVLEGFQDAINGKLVEFNGGVRDAILELKKKEQSGW
ncbi:MAG: antitoxin ParD1/3/4 [Polaribacter sp.]|jgi:antitoxin ParD1/3/4